MKLNHNCIRDLLLYIEDNLEYGYYIKINDTKLSNFPQHEVLYAADKLLEAGYLIGNRRMTMDSEGIPQINIESISWNGHQILDNVRDNKVWENTKGILSKFSSVSIGVISNVASQVISNMVKSQMGL